MDLRDVGLMKLARPASLSSDQGKAVILGQYFTCLYGSSIVFTLLLASIQREIFYIRGRALLSVVKNTTI